MKPALLVDVDNLYIVHGRINMSIFGKRIDQIKQYGKKNGMNMYWFGNTFTARLLQKHQSFNSLKLVTSHIAKDTADHAILYHVEKTRSKDVTIVSNDVSLAKVAWCLFPKKRITSLKFNGVASIDFMEPEWIQNICFKRPQDVEKFVLNLNFYMERYRKKDIDT